MATNNSSKLQGEEVVTPLSTPDSPEMAQMRVQAGAASRLLRAMGSEHRLLILCILSEGELSVGQLNQRINLAQSAVSQHLAVLRRDELVETRKQAQTVYYRLKSGIAEKIIHLLHGEFCGATGGSEVQP